MKLGPILSLLVIFGSSLCFAQKRDLEPLVPAWVDKDVKGVKFVMSLLPIESRSIADVEKRFTAFQQKNADWSDKSNLGFGAERIRLSLGLGYTTVYIDYLVFEDRIVHYKLGARVSSEDWSRHGPTVIDAWRQGGGPEFVVNDAEMTYDKDFPNEWKVYYSELSKQLGPMKPVEIPKNLDKEYKLLTDPFENSEISFVACSDGKPAIDELEDAKRVDLIENVVRGYNPGGRIYAAISLLRMQRKGRRLSAETKQAISKVVKSNASVTTCWGDTGITGLKASDVVPEYIRSKDWYRLRTWK